MIVTPFKSTKQRKKEADKGKYAEAAAKAWLDDRQRTEIGFAFHRFPDARAARGALAAQPADYLVARRDPLGHMAVLLEVKETKELRRLPKSKISQYGALGMFNLAGMWVRVLVYRSEHNDWTYFTEDELFGHHDTPASFPFEGRPTFPNAADALQEIFR